MMATMELPSALSFLVDTAIDMPDGDAFLTALAARLLADGLPLTGGALTQAAPHPVIERRIWLWRADTGRVIEALGLTGAFDPAAVQPADIGRSDIAKTDIAGADSARTDIGKRTDIAQTWLAGLGTPSIQEDAAGGARLAWSADRPFTPDEADLLREVARFAAAPLAVLAARSTLSALLTTYLGRRSAAQVLAGRLRRDPGETIRAALLFADLRGFTELSETTDAKEVIAALDAWFDRVAGAVHAFGGEVLKFIGDGVLAIFPVGERGATAACDAALRAVSAARAGMDHLDKVPLCARTKTPHVWRRSSSRRYAVGEYRDGRPAGFHRHRPCRQSRQPAGGPLPPARMHGARLRRLCGGNDAAAQSPRRP